MIKISIAICIADNSERNTACGIYAHVLPSVIRPILDRQTVIIDSQKNRKKNIQTHS